MRDLLSRITPGHDETATMQAVWNGTVIAQSDDTVVVEGNHYFPLTAVKAGVLQETTRHSVCPWKGLASYYDVVVDGDVNRHAAWYYAKPMPPAHKVAGRVAFWNGVNVVRLS